MIGKNSSVCFGMGRICENHPDKAWDEEIGCERGAGMPCVCNSMDEVGLGELTVAK